MAYTKGPWTLEEVGDKVKHLCPAKDGTSILTVAIEYDDEGDTQYFASVWSRDDAKLIGCAPELLEALKAILEVPGLVDGLPLNIYDDAYRAIAKATE